MMGSFSTMLYKYSWSYSMYILAAPTMRVVSSIFRNPTAKTPQYLNCRCTSSSTRIHSRYHIVCLYGVYIGDGFFQACGKITGTSVVCMLRMSLRL